MMNGWISRVTNANVHISANIYARESIKYSLRSMGSKLSIDISNTIVKNLFSLHNKQIPNSIRATKQIPRVTNSNSHSSMEINDMKSIKYSLRSLRVRLSNSLRNTITRNCSPLCEIGLALCQVLICSKNK
jgi:hypothetical protein